MTSYGVVLTLEEAGAARAAANQIVTTELSAMEAFRLGFLSAKRFYRIPQNIAHMYPELADMLPEHVSSNRAPVDETLAEENRRLTREREAAKKFVDDKLKEVSALQRELGALRSRVRHALLEEDEEV
ncbi:hypothetical protein QEH45_gp05 [Microbacterium phage Shocker]|uniref:Uncharacterized protein n=1 Tax=Microbacterium phage Shocker TaxID=2805839 RepID=A0A890UQQ2_9CAUD|nr:hypothetical protein QEH45_gp05 [Microbacterium phage Shocker]QRI45059.1 hypothetical protein SEA_SHOCKER_5 [Microbacterium phage Shocker]